MLKRSLCYLLSLALLLPLLPAYQFRTATAETAPSNLFEMSLKALEDLEKAPSTLELPEAVVAAREAFRAERKAWAEKLAPLFKEIEQDFAATENPTLEKVLEHGKNLKSWQQELQNRMNTELVWGEPGGSPMDQSTLFPFLLTFFDSVAKYHLMAQKIGHKTSDDFNLSAFVDQMSDLPFLVLVSRNEGFFTSKIQMDSEGRRVLKVSPLEIGAGEMGPQAPSASPQNPSVLKESQKVLSEMLLKTLTETSALKGPPDLGSHTSTQAVLRTFPQLRGLVESIKKQGQLVLDEELRRELLRRGDQIFLNYVQSPGRKPFFDDPLLTLDLLSVTDENFGLLISSLSEEAANLAEAKEEEFKKNWLAVEAGREASAGRELLDSLLTLWDFNKSFNSPEEVNKELKEIFASLRGILIRNLLFGIPTLTASAKENILDLTSKRLQQLNQGLMSLNFLAQRANRTGLSAFKIPSLQTAQSSRREDHFKKLLETSREIESMSHSGEARIHLGAMLRSIPQKSDFKNSLRSEDLSPFFQKWLTRMGATGSWERARQVFTILVAQILEDFDTSKAEEEESGAGSLATKVLKVVEKSPLKIQALSQMETHPLFQASNRGVNFRDEYKKAFLNWLKFGDQLGFLSGPANPKFIREIKIYQLSAQFRENYERELRSVLLSLFPVLRMKVPVPQTSGLGSYFGSQENMEYWELLSRDLDLAKDRLPDLIREIENYALSGMNFVATTLSDSTGETPRWKVWMDRYLGTEVSQPEVRLLGMIFNSYSLYHHLARQPDLLPDLYQRELNHEQITFKQDLMNRFGGSVNTAFWALMGFQLSRFALSFISAGKANLLYGLENVLFGRAFTILNIVISGVFGYEIAAQFALAHQDETVRREGEALFLSGNQDFSLFDESDLSRLELKAKSTRYTSYFMVGILGSVFAGVGIYAHYGPALRYRLLVQRSQYFKDFNKKVKPALEELFEGKELLRVSEESVDLVTAGRLNRLRADQSLSLENFSQQSARLFELRSTILSFIKSEKEILRSRMAALTPQLRELGVKEVDSLGALQLAYAEALRAAEKSPFPKYYRRRIHTAYDQIWRQTFADRVQLASRDPVFKLLNEAALGAPLSDLLKSGDVVAQIRLDAEALLMRLKSENGADFEALQIAPTLSPTRIQSAHLDMLSRVRKNGGSINIESLSGKTRILSEEDVQNAFGRIYTQGIKQKYTEAFKRQDSLESIVAFLDRFETSPVAEAVGYNPFDPTIQSLALKYDIHFRAQRVRVRNPQSGQEKSRLAFVPILVDSGRARGAEPAVHGAPMSSVNLEFMSRNQFPFEALVLEVAP